MSKMTAETLVSKAVDIAQHCKTLYVMGCFGAPMTAANKQRYIHNGAAGSYNAQASRKAMIQAAGADTFGFDCVCLIKGILWGWSGDASKTYGGAVYASNGVPDLSADAMIQVCTGVSSAGWVDMVPGEAVWMTGHIGIYIGGGLAVECSPKWDNKVQITAVGNIGKKAGYNTRTWTKHGKLPYVDYTEREEEDEEMNQEQFNKMADAYFAKKAAEQADQLWEKNAIARAQAAGISDGQRPRAIPTRVEVMAMVTAAVGK